MKIGPISLIGPIRSASGGVVLDCRTGSPLAREPMDGLPPAGRSDLAGLDLFQGRRRVIYENPFQEFHAVFGIQFYFRLRRFLPRYGFSSAGETVRLCFPRLELM